MAKEILSRTKELGIDLLASGADSNTVVKYLTISLHSLLEFDAHPTPEEKRQGKADCLTSSRYFVSLMDTLLPNLEKSVKIVNRSVWEPPDKKVNAHVVASIDGEEGVYLADSTPQMGPGFGEVQKGTELHSTTLLEPKDLEIIVKIQAVKHLYFQKSSEADYLASQIDSLQIPSYLYSWKASLDIMRVNRLTEKGFSNEALEKLRKVVDLNPYKSSILRTATQIAEAIEQPERLNGILSVLNTNMEKLKKFSKAKANEYSRQARECFKQGDLETGLFFLKIAWWVNNLSEPKEIVTVSIDGHRVPITNLTPKKFCSSGMVSVWTNKNIDSLPSGFDIVWTEDIDLYKQTDYGYRPIELSYSPNAYYDDSVGVMILKPNEDAQINELVSLKEVYRVENGIVGFLNSIGMSYPHLTNIDRFSIKYYKLLSDQSKQ